MTQPIPEQYLPVPMSPAPHVPHQVVPLYPPQPAPVYSGYGMVAVQPASTAATWSLVFGVMGLMFGWCTLGIPNMLALVLGHAGLSETKSGYRSGYGMAVAGTIIGWVTVLPSALIFVFFALGSIGVAA